MQKYKAMIIERDKKCVLCKNNKPLEVHHIIERHKGGDNSYRNLVTLCTVCHRVDHDKVLSKQTKRLLKYTSSFEIPDEYNQVVEVETHGYVRVAMNLKKETIDKINALHIGKNYGWNKKLDEIIEFYLKANKLIN